MTSTLLSILFIGFQAAPPKPVTTADMAKLDRKTVTVVGKVENYAEKIAKATKNPYTVFVLSDAKGKVNLHGRPAAKVKNGDKVKVTGVYTKEKKVKDKVFKNEIDASNEKVKTNGVRPEK